MASDKKKLGIGKIIGIIIVVFLVIGIVGSMGSEDSSSQNASTSAPQSASSSTTSAPETNQTEEATEPAQPAEKYTITGETLDTSNSFAAKITGTLTNNTEKEVSYIQVEYVLYDANGVQIGTAWANTSNLKAGGSWKFEAISTVEPAQVATFERADITGF